MRYSEYARIGGMSGALGTIMGLLLWAWQPFANASTGGGETLDRMIIAGLFALPVLFALSGLLRSRIYTAAWASMLAVLYMCYTLAALLTTGGTAGIGLTLAASSVLFTGCTLYPRLRAREGTAPG